MFSQRIKRGIDADWQVHKRTARLDGVDTTQGELAEVMRVIWLTPKGAQGKRTAGIGVQFSEQDRGTTQKKIESYLAGALGGDKPTHTM